MILGAFSLSLAVKNIKTSRIFYEKLGFEKFHGDEDQGWLIMKSPNAVIGLFQNMFDKNMLTFNPGWDVDAQEVNPFTDVRDIETTLKEAGIAIIKEIEGGTKGPASFLINDPDGNPILIDQHR